MPQGKSGIYDGVHVGEMGSSMSAGVGTGVDGVEMDGNGSVMIALLAGAGGSLLGTGGRCHASELCNGG